MFEVFEQSLAGLKKADELRNFIHDLLTPTEKVMLSKRLSIAVLLAKGYDYRTISGLLKVSTSTILSVVRKQSIFGEGYRLVVGKVIRNEELEKFFLDLEKTLGKIISSHPARWRRIDSRHRQREGALLRRVI